jgi:hypothetical protein
MVSYVVVEDDKQLDEVTDSDEVSAGVVGEEEVVRET